MVNLLLRPQLKYGLSDSCDPRIRSVALEHQMIELQLRLSLVSFISSLLVWHVIAYTLDAEFSKAKFCHVIMKEWTHTS